MKKFSALLLCLVSMLSIVSALKKPLDIQYTLNKTCAMGNRTEQGDVLVMHYDIVNPVTKGKIATTRTSFDFPKELRPLGDKHNLPVLDKCSYGMCVGDKRRCTAQPEMFREFIKNKWVSQNVGTLVFDIEIIDILNRFDKSPKDFICKGGECATWTPAESLWQIAEWHRLRKLYDQNKRDRANRKLVKAMKKSSASLFSAQNEARKTRVAETTAIFGPMPSLVNGI